MKCILLLPQVFDVIDRFLLMPRQELRILLAIAGGISSFIILQTRINIGLLLLINVLVFPFILFFICV